MWCHIVLSNIYFSVNEVHIKLRKLFVCLVAWHDSVGHFCFPTFGGHLKYVSVLKWLNCTFSYISWAKNNILCVSDRRKELCLLRGFSNFIPDLVDFVTLQDNVFLYWTLKDVEKLIIMERKRFRKREMYRRVIYCPYTMCRSSVRSGKCQFIIRNKIN